MAKGWTEERRQAQAERCRASKPWQKSTGPKTVKGKKASSKNALKHGLYTDDHKRDMAILRLNQVFLKLVKDRFMPATVRNKVIEKAIKSTE